MANNTSTTPVANVGNLLIPKTSRRGAPPVNPTDAFQELGTSGLRQYGGFVVEEWLQQLAGRRAAWVYREMLDNDPTVGAIMFAIRWLIRRVEFRVEEGAGGGEAAELVESAMHDMSHTWGDFISEALSMLPYGWAWHEIVYKRRQGMKPQSRPSAPLSEDGTTEDDRTVASSKYKDGRIGWRKIPVRAQETGSIAAVDLFAGAGGWDVYCAELGIDVLGIELDPQACETRAAAGYRTLQADVFKLDPTDHLCDLLIASPPCTAFSMAGKGKGRDALTVFATAIQHLRAGAPLDREWLNEQCDDPTAHLVLEPLRWALAINPTLIACEQVPPVLPLWHLMADVLRERGYSTWAGVLEAERYGVPQTRERAILMASRSSTVHPPQATHQRYVNGEPARHEMTLEGELLPWVSMAEALGWGMTERPSVAVLGASETGGRRGIDGGSGSRAVIEREREHGSIGYRLARGAGMNERYGERRDTPATEPAPVITEKARTATWEPIHDERAHTHTHTHTHVAGLPERQPAQRLRAADD